MLHHVVDPPRRPGPEPHPAVVFLHGRGANEHDLRGLLPALDPRLFSVSVRAPLPFPFGGGFTWYDVQEVGIPGREQFHESLALLRDFLDKGLGHYPIDPERVYFLGFSMGAVMASTIGLTEPRRAAGIIAHSGYAPPAAPLGLHFDRGGASGKPWLVAHGVLDAVIPVQHARETRDLLTAAGTDLEYHEYPFGHWVGEESLRDVSAWLERRLGPGAPQGGRGGV